MKASLLTKIVLVFFLTSTSVISCKKGEMGPQGLQGEQGLDGKEGDKGDKGDKGNKGDKGDRGAQGAKGDRGEKGTKGDKGETGSANVKQYTWADNGLPGIVFAAGSRTDRKFVFPLKISDFQESVVLVYGQFGNGNSIQIPYVSMFYDFHADFLYSGTGTSNCTMRITKTAHSVTSSVRFIKIRVLVIPAASFTTMSKAIRTDKYQDVKNYLIQNKVNLQSMQPDLNLIH